MKWFSRLQHWLNNKNKRPDVSKRKHADDFVQLYVDRLEERRVLSVTAALIAGELIIEGTDATEDLAIVQISNAGDPGNEVIRIFDTTDITADPIDIVDNMGNPIGNSIVTSQLPNGIKIDLGDQDDEVIMRIPSGFAGADPLQINVEGGEGDDLVTIVDNGNPLFTNAPDDASVTIDAETIRFGDENFLLGDVDLNLNGSVELTEDQFLSTSGMVDISGDVFGTVGNPAENFEVETNGNDFEVGGSLGIAGSELGNVEITASVITLGDGALTTGDQLYNGAFHLSDDATIQSTGSGNIEFDTIDGNGNSLTVSTDGDVLFNGNAAAIANLDVSGTGTSFIDAANISATESIEFNNQVIVAQNTSLSAVGRVEIVGAINSQTGEFNSLEIQSPGIGGNPALPGSIHLGSNAGTAAGGAFSSVEMTAATEISLHDVTTQNGKQSYTADFITTNSNYVTMGGDFAMAGVWDIQSNSLVDTDGGNIDLSGATLSSSNVGISLQLDATDGLNPGGLVTLGEADNTSGNVLGSLDIDAENVLFTTTNFEVGTIDVVAAEMITLLNATTTGDQRYQANTVSIEGTYETGGGAFIAIGNTVPVDVFLADDVSITTDDGTDPAGSHVDFSDVNLSATLANQSLTIDAGANANVDLFRVENDGGELLQDITITAANEITLGTDPFSITGTFQVDSATALFVTGVFLAGAANITANVTATNSMETSTGNLNVTGNFQSNSTVTSQNNFSVTGTSEFGADVTANGNIDLDDEVTLTNNVKFEATTIDLAGDLIGDGLAQHQVTLDGTSTVSGSIGGVGATLGNLIVETGALDAGDIHITGDLDANQAVTTTTGDILVGANLDTDSTLQSAGGISISGSSRLGGDVTSTFDQEYQGVVTLKNDVHFSAEDGVDGDNTAITFHQTLDEDASASSSHASFTSSDDIQFSGAIGATIPLDSLTFNSANDITFVSTVEVVGDFTVTTANNVMMNSTIELGGNYLQTAGSGTTVFNGTSGAGIGGSLDVTTANVQINSSTVTAVGNIDLQTSESITLMGMGSLDAGASTINLDADTDNDNTGSFSQSDASTITTTNETVDAISISVLGIGNAEIASLNAGTTSGVVTVNVGGEIIDATAAEAANITAFGAELTAASGIGATGGVGDIDTNVDELAFVNTSGELHIENMGALDVTMVNVIAESQALGGGTLTANSPLTISMNTIVGGNMTFTAGNSAVAGDNLTIDADVTHTDGNGFIAFAAGDDITQLSGTITNTGGAVNEVRFLADQEGAVDADRGGITQVAGMLDIENVLFEAFDDVDFSAGTNDVETLAANVDGAFTFFEVDTLGIGTVNGVSGITTAGSHVEVQSGGELTVNAEINTEPGAGGIVTVSAAILNAALTAGAGNITLNGGGLDLIINVDQSTATSASYSAPRDIIIGATVSTTAPGANLSFSADTDDDGIGGVHVLTAGQIDSAGTVLIEGSDLSTTAGAVESIRIDSDGANDQVLAVGDITLQTRAAAPVNADQIIDGRIHSTTGNIDLTANNNIQLSSNLTSDAGNIDIHSAVRLTGTSLVSATGTVTFDSTIDDDGVGATNSNLTVTATGTTLFSDAIGSSEAIESLLTNGSGTTEIESNIFTTGDIQFDDAVLLTNSSMMTSQNGDILFNSTLNSEASEANSLTASAANGTVQFADAVGTAVDGELGGLTVSAASILSIQDDVEVEGNIDLTAEMVTIEQSITTTAGGFFELTNSGQATFENASSLNLDGAFLQNGTGPVSLGADITTTDDAISFASSVTLTDDVSLDSGAGTGDVTFTDDASGDFLLSIAAGTGDVTFMTTLGVVAPLSGLLISGAGAIHFQGTAQADDEGIDLTSTGTTTFDEAVTTTDGGAVEITNGDLLTIGMNTDFNLDGSFLQNGAGSVDLCANIMTTNDDVTFFSAVTLTDDLSINTGAGIGNITFMADVSGDFLLTLSSGMGNIDFQSTVGAATPLSGLLVSSANNVDFSGTVEVDDQGIDLTSTGTSTFNLAVTTTGGGAVEITNGGLLTIGAGANFNLDGSFLQNGAGTVDLCADISTTDDDVTFTSPVILTTDVTITAGSGSVQFLSTVNDDGNNLTPSSLTISASGLTRFNSTVGETHAIDSLLTDGGGTTELNGNVTTEEAIQFDDAVVLTNSVIITSNTMGVLFNSTINDDGNAGTSSNLTVTAPGTTRFASSVGETNEIDSLLTNGTGTTELNGDVSVEGSIQFDNAVVLTNSIAITSNNAGILFNSTLDGTTAGMEDLTLTADPTGDITFMQGVGQTTPLGDVTITNANNVNLEAPFTSDSFVQQDGSGLTTVNGLVTLNGANGFNVTTNNIDLNANIDVATAALGAIVSLTADNNISLDATILSGTGDVTLSAGMDVSVTGGISSTAGPVLIEADNDVTFEMAALIDLTAGAVTVTADADADQNGMGGALFMANGALIDAGTGTILLSADADITLGGLTTTNATANAVAITSTSGGVVDGGDAHLDIVADSAGAVVQIDAATGIGSGDSLETQVAAIDLDNSGTGNIEIDEQTALIINNATQVGTGNIAISTIDGNISVTDMGVSTNGAGTVLIDANANDSSLEIDAAITTVDGTITLNADGDVSGTVNGTITSTTGDIGIHADTEVNGTGGVDLADTPIDAGSGKIDVTASQNIVLGSATTTSAADDAVSILSRDGSITADVTAMAGQLNLDSETGATITSDVDRADAVNATSGNMMITNTSELGIVGIDQQGPGDVIVSSDGTMTILDSGTGVSATTGMIDLDALQAGSDLVINQDLTTTGGEINLFAEDRVESTLGDDITSSAPASAAGDINIQSNSGDVELRGDVSAVGTGANDAGNITIDSNSANVILTNVNASAGGMAGTISVSTGQDITLTGNLDALGTAGDGSVSLDAGSEILDGNDGATLISTGDLSLTAATNIGEIDDFVARTGNAIDAVVTGLLQDLSITDAGGEIHLKIMGDLQAATGSIVPDSDGAATLLLQTTGALDVGTNPGVLDLSVGDLIGLHAGTVLTLPDTGMDVGTGATGGTLRLSGGTDVVDPAGRELGKLIAQDLFFTSNSTGGETTLNLDVTNLDADLSGAPAGTSLIINNEGDLNANNVVTNDGDIRINNGLMQRGDLRIGQIDAGAGDVILDTTANGGALRDLDENELPANTNTDIIAAGLAIRIANNSVMNVLDHTLEVEIETLAAEADNLAIKILDESGDLELGTVDSLSSITVTNADADDVIEVVTVGMLNINENVSSTGLADIFLAAAGNGENNDLNLDANISKQGTAGNVSLIAGDDLSVAATSSVTAENDSSIKLQAGVDVLTPDVPNAAPFSSGNANGDILMSDGSFIGTDEGTITINATRDVALTLLNANNDADGVLGNIVVTADDNGLADSTPNGDGEIREVLSGETVNLIADNASLSAATGIGAADDLNMDVNSVDATNSTAGDIQLFEVTGTGDNDLTVNLISNQNGNVNVQTDDGTLTIGGPVSTTGPGNVVLTAGDDDLDGNGDLLIQSSIMSVAGSVTLTSDGNDVQFTNAGDVSTTSGRVDITAGATDDMGNITQTANSVIDAGNAQVEFNANGQITLGQIVTTNGSTQAVTLNADQGVESADPPNILNIDAANGRLVINTDSGVAPIRTTVESLDVVNMSTGGVTITETDAVNVIRVDQNAAAGIDITSGGTMTIVGGEHGVTGTSEPVNLTTEGAGSEIVINSTVQSTAGKITINAADDVRMGAASTIITAASELLVIGGDALDAGSTTSGGILMEDGALIEATDARVDLVAKENVQVGRIVTSTDVRLTSTEGAITDAGESGGVDINAMSLGLDAATGIGDGNAIETSVATLAASNSTSGGIEIDNTTGSLLTIGDFNNTPLDATLGPLSGMMLSGANPENLILTHDAELLVDSPVLNTTGGEIDLTSGADFTVQAVVMADINNALGIVRLNSGADLIVLDTNPGDLLASDIEGFQVIGTAASAIPDFDQGTGGTVYDPSNPDLFNPPEKVSDPENFDPNNPAHLATLPVRFAENVIVRSSTGSITQPVPSLTNLQTPQVLSTGIATITGDFGRDDENTFTYVVDWDSVFGDDTEVFNSGDPLFSQEDGMVIGTVPGAAPGTFDFDHQFFGNPNPDSPSAPILLTISVFDDSNISFFANGGTVDLGEITMDSEAPVPGEGLAGGFVFDVSVEVPQIEAPRVQFSDSQSDEIEDIIDVEEDDFSEGVADSEGTRDELILIIQKIGPDGKVEKDQFGRPVQRTLQGADALERLNDLPALHKRLDSGHWKIFTKEGEDGQMMLVEDVVLRNGRPVAGEEGTQDRPPTAESAGDSTGTMPEMNDSKTLPATPEKPDNEKDDSGTSQLSPVLPKFDQNKALSQSEEGNQNQLAALAVLPVSSQAVRKVGQTLHQFKHFAGLLLGLLR